MNAPKLSDAKKSELIGKYRDGVTQKVLAEEFGISLGLVSKITRKAGGRWEETSILPPAQLAKFQKQVKSVLWKLGGEHEEYDRWHKRIKEYEEFGEMNHGRAVIAAAKEFPCLEKIFKEYNLLGFHPQQKSKTRPTTSVKCEDKLLSHRESLAWAIEAAGHFRRTGTAPATTPNDTCYFLYEQARDDSKDFLSKYNQIEKGMSDEEDKRLTKRTGERSIEEINEMLETLSTPGESEALL